MIPIRLIVCSTLDAFTIKQPCSTSDYLLELYHPSRFLRISTNWAMAHGIYLTPRLLAIALLIVISGHLCDDIFTRISDYEPDRVYSAIRYRRCEGTTMWFLNKIYKEHPSWRRSSTSCLWLSGPSKCLWSELQASRTDSVLVGSGKTFIAYVQASNPTFSELMLTEAAQLLSNRSQHLSSLVISFINLLIVIK